VGRVAVLKAFVHTRIVIQASARVGCLLARRLPLH
jgi:hypothetical protein